MNENSFSYERMSTKTWFETEAKGNSEMAYYTAVVIWYTAWLPQVRKLSGKKKQHSPKSGKSKGILFWIRKSWQFDDKSGKIETLKQSWFNTIKGWMKHLGSLWSQLYFSLMRKETYGCSWMGRKMPVSWGQKPLLDLAFCTYLVREMLILSGKKLSGNLEMQGL